ncbi:uncharacterized protein LOC143287414 [Babylonia areolata]|uniref:uncharacterized protein LOC143287414 n=1 Tax=Babylonia areolata TaxID=304850 RepID=UPI003FCF6AA7
MQNTKTSLVGLLLILIVTVSIVRSAVLPMSSTTTLMTPSPVPIDQYKDDRKPCDSHDDCQCSFGMGVCFQGKCECVWGVSNKDTKTEAEVAAFMSHHSDVTTGSATVASKKVL